jgi:hypothetical protein
LEKAAACERGHEGRLKHFKDHFSF